jgi:hypothetical protein
MRSAPDYPLAGPKPIPPTLDALSATLHDPCVLAFPCPPATVHRDPRKSVKLAGWRWAPFTVHRRGSGPVRARRDRRRPPKLVNAQERQLSSFNMRGESRRHPEANREVTRTAGEMTMPRARL